MAFAKCWISPDPVTYVIYVIWCLCLSLPAGEGDIFSSRLAAGHWETGGRPEVLQTGVQTYSPRCSAVSEWVSEWNVWVWGKNPPCVCVEWNLPRVWTGIFHACGVESSTRVDWNFPCVWGRIFHVCKVESSSLMRLLMGASTEFSDFKETAFLMRTHLQGRK